MHPTELSAVLVANWLGLTGHQLLDQLRKRGARPIKEGMKHFVRVKDIPGLQQVIRSKVSRDDVASLGPTITRQGLYQFLGCSVTKEAALAEEGLITAVSPGVYDTASLVGLSRRQLVPVTEHEVTVLLDGLGFLFPDGMKVPVTAAQARKLLGCSRHSIDQLVHRKKLTASVEGPDGRRYFDGAEIIQLLLSRKGQSRTGKPATQESEQTSCS
jgi:hypothetical protein